jgi:hypothetical protein
MWRKNRFQPQDLSRPNSKETEVQFIIKKWGANPYPGGEPLAIKNFLAYLVMRILKNWQKCYESRKMKDPKATNPTEKVQ